MTMLETIHEMVSDDNASLPTILRTIVDILHNEPIPHNVDINDWDEMTFNSVQDITVAAMCLEKRNLTR